MAARASQPPDFSEPIVVQFRADREYATDLNQFTGYVSKFNLVPPSAVKNQSELTRRYSLPARTFQNDTNIFFMPPPNRKLRKDGLKSQPRDVMIETLTNRSLFKTWMTQHTSKFDVSTTDISSVLQANEHTTKNAKTYVEFLFDDGKSFYKSPFTNDNSFTIIDNSFINMEQLTDLTNYREQRFSVNFILDLVAGKPKEIKKIIRAKKCQKQERRLDKALQEQGVTYAIESIKSKAGELSTTALTGLVGLGTKAASVISNRARRLWERIRKSPTPPTDLGGGKRKSKRKRRNLTRKKSKAKKQRKTKKRKHKINTRRLTGKPNQEA